MDIITFPMVHQKVTMVYLFYMSIGGGIIEGGEIVERDRGSFQRRNSYGATSMSACSNLFTQS